MKLRLDLFEFNTSLLMFKSKCVVVKILYFINGWLPSYINANHDEFRGNGHCISVLIRVLFPLRLILFCVFSGLAHGGDTKTTAFQMMKSKGRGPLTLMRNSKVIATTPIWSKLWMGKVRFGPYLLNSSCTDF